MDWKKHGNHKDECAFVEKRDGLGRDETLLILELALRRIRMYLCPFVVCKTEKMGKGVAFVKSKEPIKDWIYIGRRDWQGRLLNRSFVVEFLTLGEFDGLAFEDDFELATVRPKLQAILDEYDVTKEMVVLVLTGCGFFACASFPLIPDVTICKPLGDMYKYADMDCPLQLNVDITDEE